METQVINYFISKDYVPDWTINEAIREIMQNFLDYGEYTTKIDILSTLTTRVELTNSWKPENLNFLIIGSSSKDANDRGKYGEGLKLAALVLLRNDFRLTVRTTTHTVRFALCDNKEATQTLGVNIYKHDEVIDRPFTVSFDNPSGVFEHYVDNIIKPIDIIHHLEGVGSIVNKPKGNIYVGGLFVCNLTGYNYSYDFYANKVPLDRDRSVPREFDVKFYAGKIQETFKNFDISGHSADVTYSNIPNSLLTSYKPVIKDNEITFFVDAPKGTKTAEGVKVHKIEVSREFKDKLKSSNFFDKVINKLKELLFSAVGIDTLAVTFRKKYCHSVEMQQDFDILLERLGINIEKEDKEQPDLPF